MFRGKAAASLAALLLLSVALLSPGRIQAQAHGHPYPLDGDRFSTSPEFYLGVNVLAGGVSAMARAFFTDAHPVKAFVQGAVGGAISYGGQRMIGTGREDLRFAGVQTVALGANVSRNAGAGVGVLSDLTFPLYPFYLRYQTHDTTAGRFTVRLSALNLVGTAYMALQFPEAKLSWEESLRAAHPVFQKEAPYVVCKTYYAGACWTRTNGRHVSGATIYATEREGAAATLTHEVVHHGQFLRDAVMHGVPASDALLKPLGPLRNFLVIDGFLPLSAAALASGNSRGNYYEREADAMMGRDRCKKTGVICSW